MTPDEMIRFLNDLVASEQLNADTADKLLQISIWIQIAKKYIEKVKETMR